MEFEAVCSHSEHDTLWLLFALRFQLTLLMAQGTAIAPGGMVRAESPVEPFAVGTAGDCHRFSENDVQPYCVLGFHLTIPPY